jgi:hypothetical protein
VVGDGLDARDRESASRCGGRGQRFPCDLLYPDLFSIGVLSDFRKLWQQGFGKLAAVYFDSLFGFVIWVGLLISWLFFSGFKPPLAS